MHLILIGFKHVGKTQLGKQLSKRLHYSFIDLDKSIEKSYLERMHHAYNARQIVEAHGEPYFRALETETLKIALKNKPSIISLGGGTPMLDENQRLIKPHTIFHIIAPRGIVFERIMVGGRPSVFDPKMDAYDAFTALWEQRETIYQKLTNKVINNAGTINEAVDAILRELT